MSKYKLKYTNFSQQIERQRNFNELYRNNFEAIDMPIEYLKTILSEATIVIYNGKYWLKDYDYKGVMNEIKMPIELFKQFIELYNRPKIKVIK